MFGNFLKINDWTDENLNSCSSKKIDLFFFYFFFYSFKL